MDIKEKAKQVRKASRLLSFLPAEKKDAALNILSIALKENEARIIVENNKDIERAKADDLGTPLLKRLKFDHKKILKVCEGISSLLGLKDPNGRILSSRELDEGLNLYQVACPIGVIGMIFESRPDALVQIASLCLKSGNGVILKGGSEAFNTNRILYEIINKSTVQAGLPEGWIQLAETRDDVKEMLSMNKYIDLLIPRGSNQFVQYIMKNTSIPVLGHADGICHAYIDSEADITKAVRLIVDSKTQYVAVCNALETLLVNRSIAGQVLPLLKQALETKNVLLRGCPDTVKIIEVEEAVDKDWETEYLDYILSIKLVDSAQEAVEHIHQYGSGHTEMIVTENKEIAESFMNQVDSADVFWNCSTRFSDGFRFGFGAEVGISTNKIHSRGPVGMEGLMIYKWKLYGDGHIVADYEDGSRKFTHKDTSNA